MNETRPTLAHARKASDDILARMVYDGSLTVDTANAMAVDGFRAATRELSDLRRVGVSVECITGAFQHQLAAGRAAGDAQKIVSAEYTLAVWNGMQRDLAEWLGATG